MKQNTKDWIQYSSAIALIASAIGLAVGSFIVIMDIGAGTLTYIGEALGGALGIFGVATYAKARVDDMERRLFEERDRLDSEDYINRQSHYETDQEDYRALHSHRPDGHRP